MNLAQLKVHPPLSPFKKLGPREILKGGRGGVGGKSKIVKRVVWNGGRQAALFTAFTILVNDVCEPIEKILIPTSLHIWPGDCQLVSYPVYHLPFCEHTRELG